MVQQDIQDEARAYRRTLGAFATGVALIGADCDRGVAGLIVNSFTSVSLEPRLVLWCLGVDSDRFGIFSEAPLWGVSFLSEAQRPVSDRLARRGALTEDSESFERLQEAPVLGGAVAALACRTHERITMGDHLILVGEVIGHRVGSGPALTYFRGAYGVAGGDS